MKIKILTKAELDVALNEILWSMVRPENEAEKVRDSHEALRRLLKFAWWLVTDEGREQVDADTRQTILDAIGDES